MSNITSSLTIKLVDDVSGPAKKIAESLKLAEQQAKEIGRALEQAGVSDRLSQSLRRIGASAGQIKIVGEAWANYARKAQLAARASDWTKAQAANVKTWERQTVSALRNVIREEQRFAEAQRRARDAASGAGRSILGSGITGRGIMVGAGGVALGAGLPAVGGAIVTGMAGKKLVESAARFQSEIIKQKVAGMSQAEITAGELQSSLELMKKYPMVSRTEIMRTGREARASLVHPEDVTEMLEPLIATQAALIAAGIKDASVTPIVKAAEIMGITRDKEKLRTFLDTYVKAQQVSGGTLRTEDPLEFAKFSKLAGVPLSDRFRAVSMSLMQEMGGALSGTALNQYVKQITGSFRGPQASALKDWLNLGLVRKEDIEFGPGGAVHGLKPGAHPINYRKAAENPDLYMYEDIMPAMVKKGITDQTEQVLLQQKLFPAGRAADAAQKFIVQQENFTRHSENYAKALGLNSVGESLKDVTVAASALKTSFENLGSTLGMMNAAASAMTGVLNTVNSMAASLAQGRAGQDLTDKIDSMSLKGVPSSVLDLLGKEKDYIRDLFSRQPATEPPEAAALPPPPPAPSPYGTLAQVTPDVDTSSMTNAGQTADETKMKIEGLNVTVAPNVDTAAIDLALGKVQQLNAELAKTGSLASSVGSGISADTAAAARLRAAMGSIQRGRFATGGVQGD